MSSVSLLMPEIDFAVDELPNLPEVLDQLRELGPVSPVKFVGKQIWLINDYKTVKKMMGNDEFFSAPGGYKPLLEPTMGKVLATMTGPQHRLNRAVVANVFFPKKMRELADTMFTEEAELLADTLEACNDVDLVADYTKRYTFNNITRLLGLPREDVTIVQDWADRIMQSYIDIESAVSAGREMGEYLTPIITERRASPKEDVVSLLIEATVDGEGLSDDEILAFCRNLFPAAIDTSTNSLGSLIYTLLQRPELWAAFATDESCRDPIIDELLRIESPLVMVPRRCVKQVELGGYTINVGDDVRICIAGANLDPAQFENPTEYNPGRGAKNLTFGHGEHFCLGSHMAKRVLETGLKTLTTRFPDMALCEDKPVRIVGGVLRGPRQLWVRPNYSS